MGKGHGGFTLKIGGGGGWGHHHHHHSGGLFGHNHYRHHHHHHNNWLFAPSRPVYYDRYETSYYYNNTANSTTNYYGSNYEARQRPVQQQQYNNTANQQANYSDAPPAFDDLSYQTRQAPANNYAAQYQPVNVTTHKPKSTSHVTRGIAAYNSGNLSNAKWHFQEVLDKRTKRNQKKAQQQQSNKAVAHRYLGKIALAEGNTEEAHKHFVNLEDLYYEITKQISDANKPYDDNTDLNRIEELLQDLEEAREFASSALPLFDPRNADSISGLIAQLDVRKKDLLKKEAQNLLVLSTKEIGRLGEKTGGVTGYLFGYNAKYNRVWNAGQALQAQITASESNPGADINTTPLLAALKSKRTHFSFGLKDADSWKAVPEAVRRTFR